MNIFSLNNLFNDRGELHTKSYLSFLTFIFLLSYSVSSIAYLYYTNFPDIEYNLSYFLDTISIYYLSIINGIFIPFFYGGLLEEELLTIQLKLIILPTILISIFIYYVRKSINIQRKLSSMGLEQYFLKSKNNNVYIFQLRDSEKMDYEKFVVQFENAKQLFSKGALSIQRYKHNQVKVIFKNNIPTLEKLSKIDIFKYLKKDQIFVGFSGGLTKSIEPNYIPISKLLHVGNFGTSGGGKSNTLNFLIHSIFHNIDLCQEVIFVDFKGGIEAEPYRKLEVELQTGKITTLDDDRKKLLDTLERLNDINKSRMKELVDKGEKQFKKDYIFLLLDEVAEILQYKPTHKEAKEIQSNIVEILESLFRTGRSQGFRIFVSTQSFVGNASGLSGGMKNNIKTKIMHLTQSQEAIASVFPEKELLSKEGINPEKFSIGEFVIDNEGSELIHARSLYVPEKTETLVTQLKQVIQTTKKDSYGNK